MLSPTSTVCEAGDALSPNSLTMTVNDRLLVQTPSVTDTVMSDEPVWPDTGATVMVRLVPLPPSARLASGIKV